MVASSWDDPGSGVFEGAVGEDGAIEDFGEGQGGAFNGRELTPCLVDRLYIMALEQLPDVLLAGRPLQ